jgi:broad specificity phosphatase PhoE
VPTIVLARHGKPVARLRRAMPGRDLAAWVREGDNRPLDRTRPPPAELEQIARAFPLIVASPLRRSRESVALLRPGYEPQVDAIYREVFRPTALHTGLRLPPAFWELLTRAAWLAGWSPGVESYRAAERRAVTAADRLVVQARDHGSVLLVGHGFMDGLIARRRRRTGWRGPRFRPRRYWAFSRYEYS